MVTIHNLLGMNHWNQSQKLHGGQELIIELRLL